MRANEYLFILNRHFQDDLRIEGISWETEYGTVYYHVAAYLKSKVIVQLQNAHREQDLANFFVDGAAAVLDVVVCEETFEEAIEKLFITCDESGLLEDYDKDEYED